MENSKYNINIKNIFIKILKSLVGGMLLIPITLIIIYFIAGNNSYQIEVMQFLNFNSMISKLVVCAIIGGIIQLIYELSKILNKSFLDIKYDKNENKKVKKILKLVMIQIVVFSILLGICAYLIVGKLKSESYAFAQSLIIVMIFGLVVYGLIAFLRDLIDERKINEKIKNFEK